MQQPLRLLREHRLNLHQIIERRALLRSEVMVGKGVKGVLPLLRRQPAKIAEGSRYHPAAFGRQRTKLAQSATDLLPLLRT